MSRAALATTLTCALMAACGSSEVAIDVAFDLPTKGVLSPYDPAARITRVRVEVDGAERLDEVAQDLDATTRAARFEGYPIERDIRVLATGYDEIGNVVAFGEAAASVETDDLEVTVSFRRSLAYVIHRDICDGGCGEGEICANGGGGHRCLPSLEEAACGMRGCDATRSEVCVRLEAGPSCRGSYGGGSQGVERIYALDLNTKVLVDAVGVPRAGLRPLSITSQGGDGVWVALREGTKTLAAFLSSSTHIWSTPFELHLGADYLISGPGLGFVVAAGGGFITAHDPQTGAQVRKIPVGGRVVDGVVSGEKVLIATSDTLALVDLEVADAAIAVNPVDVLSPSGVALSSDGRTAYVTSAATGVLIAYDMRVGGAVKYDAAFPIPVRDLVFSDRGEMLLGIHATDPNTFVNGYNLPDSQPFPAAESVGTLPLPGGIAAGASGSRVIVVSAGTSTGSAGFTILDPQPGESPTGSTILYPRDPIETFTEGGNTFRQRYRPAKVAALYGR